MNKIIAAGIGLAFALSAPVYAADEIVFDPDGTGVFNGDTLVGSWDWLFGSAITVDVIPTQTGQFVTYSHATLATSADAGGDPSGWLGLNSGNATIDFEITFVAGFTEQITSVTNSNYNQEINNGGVGTDVYSFQQTILLGNPGSDPVNFFEIYWDDNNENVSGTTADALSGTGYADGTLIASGTVANVSGNFTTEFTFTDVNNNGTYEAGTDIIIGSADVGGAGGYALLDQNADGDDWSGQETVTGIGATALNADLSYQDTDFFKTNITSLVFDLNFNTSNILPFSETNPAQSYYDGSGQVSTVNRLGDVNGLSGPDILFQADANNSFNTEVPEPKSVMLFALGLLLLGASARRSNNHATEAV